MKRGKWSPEEDKKLKNYMEKHGNGGNWMALPLKAGLNRCGNSCRLRWLNYLRPNIKHGNFSEEEDILICDMFAKIGRRWSIMAKQLPGRTGNDIKNHWNTKLSKKVMISTTNTPTLFGGVDHCGEASSSVGSCSATWDNDDIDHQTPNGYFENNNLFDTTETSSYSSVYDCLEEIKQLIKVNISPLEPWNNEKNI